MEMLKIARGKKKVKTKSKEKKLKKKPGEKGAAGTTKSTTIWGGAGGDSDTENSEDCDAIDVGGDEEPGHPPAQGTPAALHEIFGPNSLEIAMFSRLDVSAITPRAATTPAMGIAGTAAKHTAGDGGATDFIGRRGGGDKAECSIAETGSAGGGGSGITKTWFDMAIAGAKAVTGGAAAAQSGKTVPFLSNSTDVGGRVVGSAATAVAAGRREEKAGLAAGCGVAVEKYPPPPPATTGGGGAGVGPSFAEVWKDIPTSPSSNTSALNGATAGGGRKAGGGFHFGKYASGGGGGGGGVDGAAAQKTDERSCFSFLSLGEHLMRTFGVGAGSSIGTSGGGRDDDGGDDESNDSGPPPLWSDSDQSDGESTAKVHAADGTFVPMKERAMRGTDRKVDDSEKKVAAPVFRSPPRQRTRPPLPPSTPVKKGYVTAGSDRAMPDAGSRGGGGGGGGAGGRGGDYDSGPPPLWSDSDHSDPGENKRDRKKKGKNGSR